MYVAAVFSTGQIAVGHHHGDAFAHLDNHLQVDDLLVSGHVNPDGSFTTEMQHLKKNIIIVRHAESEFNAGLTPDLDSTLTHKGKQQGNRTAEFIRQLQLDGYQGYTSPFQRCLATSRMIREATGINFRVCRDISEVTLDFPEDGVQIPCRHQEYQEFEWEASSSSLHFPKEPPRYFLSRLAAFLDSLEDNSIIVTHGTCVMTLVEMSLGAHVEKIAEWDGSIPNASVSYVTDGTLKYMGKAIE